MVRPSKSIEWPHNSSIDILLSNDIVEYCSVDERGYPTLHRRPYTLKTATVILGKHTPENGRLSLSKSDKIWTCYFSGIGHLTSISNQYAGKDLTVIIHI
jgi:hypothetical protein